MINFRSPLILLKFMVDYKEVTKKDGTKIIFCKFHDLLKEFYGTEDYEGNLISTGDHEEYIIRCPLCAHEHTKHKLYISGDLSVGFCFLCGRTYMNVTDDVDVTINPPKFNEYMGYQGFELVELNDPIWTLDRFKYEFDDFDEKGYKYLIGRHGFMKDLYKVLHFKFMDGNIVMPFYYHDKLIYYQLRFTGNSKIRYFFPPIKKKPPYIIDRPGIRKLIVCEGVYDAIACLIMAPDFIPVAVLGSSVSDYQIEFMREYLPNEILVYMDETDISKRIASKIRSVIDYCPIGIIKSDGEDPEENMKKILRRNGNLQWIKSRIKEENSNLKNVV